MKNAATLCAAPRRVASRRAAVCDRVCLDRTFACTLACSYSNSYRTCSFVPSLARSLPRPSVHPFVRFFARSSSLPVLLVHLESAASRNTHIVFITTRWCAQRCRDYRPSARYHARVPFLRCDASSSKLVPVPLHPRVRPRALVSNLVSVLPAASPPVSTCPAGVIIIIISNSTVIILIVVPSPLSVFSVMYYV